MDMSFEVIPSQPWVGNIEESEYLQFENRRVYDEREVIEEEEKEELNYTVISSPSAINATRVTKVLYVEDLPEYPETSETGVAYVINVSHMSEEKVNMMCDNVQYCYKRAHPDKKCHSSILNNAHCQRSTFICTGVTCCEYLDPTIASMQHSKLEDSDWQLLIDKRNTLGRTSENRDANSFFLSIKHLFQAKKACKDQDDSCTYRLSTSPVPSISGEFTTYFQCINSLPSNKHFFRAIPGHFQSQVSFLEERVLSTYEIQQESCVIIEQNSTRRPHCGIDHEQGRGSLIRHSSSLLKNPQVALFCQQFQRKTLSEIHSSLVNSDKLSLILRKKQMHFYPEAQQIAGLQYEYRMKHKDQEDSYIQYIYSDSNNFMAICCLKEAIKVLVQLESFEVDMSFKRVQDSEINEVVFAANLPQLNKVMTFVRVYVNQQSTQMYTTLFREVFRIISQQTGYKIQWQHLHGSGFGCIVMDMDSAQMSALEDTSQKSIRHIIHGSGMLNDSELQKRMEQLLYVKSREDYNELCDSLINSEFSSPQVVNWTKHKQHLCIAPGINPYCSQIAPDLFERTRKHTDAVEQTYFKSTSLGKRLSLVKAVQYGEILDRRDMDQYNSKVLHGINHTWRSNSMAARFAMSESREKRKRSRAEMELGGSNDELEILTQETSSDYSRDSSRSRSRSSPPGRRKGTSSRSQTPISQTPIRQVLSQSASSIPSLQSEEREMLQLQKERALLQRLLLRNRVKELEIEEMELELLERRQRLRNQGEA
ncbi:hypothetical protein BP5796_00395 [Coleophoma crateriformis]|uniref:Uncharacterized protein n=1 Tax=Coleophoma crateriformis TaxID=565419 RepID=A0A3D8T7R3_9HELO|nr:hypothetical protein BP5796_00395 [Coleophoma crateriformis]